MAREFTISQYAIFFERRNRQIANLLRINQKFNENLIGSAHASFSIACLLVGFVGQ